MRSISPIVAMAVIALAGPLVVGAMAADPNPDKGGPPSSPNRNVEERPFGGPPPKQRNPYRYSTKCQTANKTCTLEKRRVVGAKCTCPDDAAEGKVVE